MTCRHCMHLLQAEHLGLFTPLRGRWIWLPWKRAFEATDESEPRVLRARPMQMPVARFISYLNLSTPPLFEHDIDVELFDRHIARHGGGVFAYWAVVYAPANAPREAYLQVCLYEMAIRFVEMLRVLALRQRPCPHCGFAPTGSATLLCRLELQGRMRWGARVDED